jgi:HTH-type transcriptional regulator/antitoxin HigA
MPLNTKKTRVEDSYLALVKEFPLRPLRNDEEHEAAIWMTDRLLSRKKLTVAEEDYLQVLFDIIQAYEEEHDPILPVPDDVMLQSLIEAKCVTQAQVAKEAGIAQSTISAVLSGKRKLTRAHIAKLAAYFRVKPDVFDLEAR